MRSMLWRRAGDTILFFIPSLAYAHGDDNVTAASFIGPVVALLVFATVVGLGKIVLRRIVRRS